MMLRHYITIWNNPLKSTRNQPLSEIFEKVIPNENQQLVNKLNHNSLHFKIYKCKIFSCKIVIYISQVYSRISEFHVEETSNMLQFEPRQCKTEIMYHIPDKSPTQEIRNFTLIPHNDNIQFRNKTKTLFQITYTFFTRI